MVKLLKELNDFSYDYEEVKKAQKEGGPLVVSGILQRADAVNHNGRIYPREVLEPQIEAYKILVKERRATGELDHSDEAVVNLKNVSHVITDIWMENNGDVRGKVEVLPTPMGEILASLIKSNIKVGISSRALGSVDSTNQGDVVQDDLFLICFDIVSEPSTVSAWLMKESRDYSRDEIKDIINRQQRINMSINDILKIHKTKK